MKWKEGEEDQKEKSNTKQNKTKKKQRTRARNKLPFLDFVGQAPIMSKVSQLFKFKRLF